MSVRVAVRFRPDVGNSNNQTDEIEQNLLIYPQLNCVNIARHFNLYFHDVLPLYSTQDEVFNIVQPLVDDFLQGNNISIITYGPSGCGKTHTMFGNGGTQTNPENVYRLGLMPRVISYIFDQLQQRFNTKDGEFIYQLQCTFLEIYNKKMIDLLNPYAHKHKNKHTKVKFIKKQNGSYDHQNLTKVTISSIADVLRYMYTAFHNRKYVKRYDQESKYKNKYTQSKSHCVATLKLIFKKRATNELFKVSMVFIDCGAYCKSTTMQQPKHTMHKPKQSVQTVEDAQYINRAFLSLGNVLTALHRSTRNDEEPREIPWKDNNLTQTLHSLCTAATPSKVLLFLNCSLKSYLYEETLATLRFGNLAMTDPMLLNVMDNYRKKIKSLNAKMSKHKGKMDSKRSLSGDDELLEQVKTECSKLKKEMRHKERVFNDLNIENEDNVQKLDSSLARITTMELSEIELENELERAQTNEELLRDENDDLQQRIHEMEDAKQGTMRFIDTDFKAELSEIQSRLAQDNDNPDARNKEMIDELSQQIESLENLKAQLKYEIAQKTEEITSLIGYRDVDKTAMLKQQEEILYYKTHYISRTQTETEIEGLMEQIKERDARIQEYEGDIRENILNSGEKWREKEEIYESTIKELEQQLKESKNVIQLQHERMHNIHNVPDMIPMEINQKGRSISGTGDDGGNANQMQELRVTIRKLKLEITRMKSAQYRDEKIAKLKKKNNALEERLIRARSEKAKMLPSLLREKTELKNELKEMKTSFAIYVVKWKFIQLKYMKQIRDCRSDLDRYQRKLDTQIKGKQKMGAQMETLDKMAHDTVKSAIHQRFISNMPVGMDSMDSGGNDPDTTLLNIVSENDNGNAAINASLPEHLRRVQKVIKDLTTKLQKKHDKINDLEQKLALYKFSMSRSSHLGRGSSHSGYGGLQSPTASSVPITPSHSTTMFAQLSMTTTDFDESPILEPIPGDFDEKDNLDIEDAAMYESQEQYLKAFLNKTTTMLPPTPEKTLSLGFFINNAKNIRVSMDVSMTFSDILRQLLHVNKAYNLKDLQLQIEQNPDPIETTIVIEQDMFKKTFWDLILEYGLFSLLKFNVITNATQLQAEAVQIKQKHKKRSLFKRLKSKKTAK